MSYYRPTRIRWGRVLAYFVRGVAGLLVRWPLLLLAAFIISPIGPHLRLQYTYQQQGSYRYMLNCEYLGSRGFVNYVEAGRCPVFTIIDTRKMTKRWH
jgi:hypothetical protein